MQIDQSNFLNIPYRLLSHLLTLLHALIILLEQSIVREG